MKDFNTLFLDIIFWRRGRRGSGRVEGSKMRKWGERSRGEGKGEKWERDES
jgi:hypothetical protein